MRHTIGGTWLLQLMILFILLFVGFIVLTLNYSRTVKIKNELINMFEKYEGINDSSVELANNYLLYTGYDVGNRRPIFVMAAAVNRLLP